MYVLFNDLDHSNPRKPNIYVRLERSHCINNKTGGCTRIVPNINFSENKGGKCIMLCKTQRLHRHKYLAKN